MSDQSDKSFQKLVRQLGRLIRAEADKAIALKKSAAKAKAPAWVSAFVDARWFSDAEGWSAKFRVLLPNGSQHSVRTTDEMDTLLDKLRGVRKEDSSAEWYGLKVTVTPDGAVTTELNNDPNCVVDPTWFDS